MTSYKNKAITYNTNGGVASYDGYNYTWSNGKLSSIRKPLENFSRAILPSLQSSRTYSFGYNGLGQRVSSDYNYINVGNLSVQLGELTSYNKKFSYDHSGRLISETVSKTFYGEGTSYAELVYLYDESGIVGVQYTNGVNSNAYYFLRNLQGDVIAIYDTNGVEVVSYSYDAWGNCTINSSTTNYDLAHDNPIRYRGYYYDEDTKLYYLNSRYYSPEFRRFISPDDTAYLDPESVNGLNLYCYCGNDPVNFVDPSGHLAVTTFAIIAGVFFGFGISVTSSIVTQLEEHNGNWNEVNPYKVFYDGVFGAINGAFAASGIGIGWSVAIGAASGFLSSVGSDYLFNGGKINWGAAVNSLIIGAIAGRIAGAGANYAGDGMQVAKFANSRYILNRTIANGTKRAIARQTHALTIHKTNLFISGVRYMLSNAFSISYTMITN